MTLDKVETVLWTLTFIVPGFLINNILSLFTLRKKEEKELLLLRFLAFSTLNLVVCLPLIRFLIKEKIVEGRPFIALGVFFVINFVCPLILGIFLSALDHWQIIRRICSAWMLNRMNMNPLHPTPSAWEYCFDELCKNIGGPNKGYWVLIRLSDGSEVAGFFGGQSFASTDSNERDLFLDYVYDIDYENQGPWMLRQRSAGVLIKGSTILSIEILKDEKITEETQEVENAGEESSEPCADGGHREGNNAAVAEGIAAAAL